MYVSHLFERWKDMNELKRGRDDSGIPFRVLVDRNSSHVVGVCEGVCEDVCEDGLMLLGMSLGFAGRCRGVDW